MPQSGRAASEPYQPRSGILMSAFVSPPNKPSCAEIEVVSRYLARVLTEMEAVDQDETQVRANTVRAISIRRALADLLSPDGGDYVGLVDALNERLDAEARLGDFLASRQIGVVAAPVETNFPYPLQRGDFVDRDIEHVVEELEAIGPASDYAPADPAQKAFDSTSSLLIEFLAYLLQREQPTRERPARLLFLLRDTLLLYLGARRLMALGAPVDARAALISRAVVQSFTPDAPRNPLYARLYNGLFQCLADGFERFDQSYLTCLATRFANEADGKTVVKHVSRYLQSVVGTKTGFIAIDIGANGTMPLLAMVAHPSVEDLRLYAAAPWLEDFYGDRICQTNAEDLRRLETPVCQEELFFFVCHSGDRLIVRENQDPSVRARAHWEIAHFLRRLEERFANQWPEARARE